ncbi:MarR family transcriptional regulator [Azorhizobium doebereinerae]|uniref:MarR family transcriptional regulator n=1 Tax=Azorhizobium doebereinerae TaxID=281091 RepID=UPI000686B187|nr:MarR family transcriptional regulator [Azorhizobium doebereinerae]
MGDEIRLVLSAEGVLAHPGFGKARDIYIREMLELHENQPTENRLLIDGGTASIFFSVIIMNAGYQPDVRSTWPTMQSLKSQMEAHGIASGRRTHDIVRRLIDRGYITTFTAQRDRRSTLLAPTDKMLAHDQRSLLCYFHPLHALFPDPGYPEPMRRDLAFHRAAREVSIAFLAHAQQFILANPVIAFFLPRQAGHMILTKLMHLCGDQDDHGVPKVSFVKIGDSFGVSRTHVRKLLREAEELGFVRLFGNSVAVTATCRAGFDRFLADTMAGNDLVYRLAMAKLASMPAAGAQSVDAAMVDF